MKLLILTLFATSLCAQTETPVPTIKDLPQYFAVVGGGLSPTANIKGAANAGEGFVSMAARLGNSQYYSISTIDITTAQNSARTGLARVMAQSGKMSLLARIDAGISTASPTISSFSAGAIVTYQFRPSWYFVGELRMTANPSGPAGTVQLGTYWGLARSF